ncbi:geminin [Lucilia sericata]|uniref:geminin n=1 Tax=Lucilia sericata TaxID=13632 RepID=UPI0018A7F597|nr:geminin [Lucilia sericata]
MSSSLSNAATKKVYIQVESAAEQQENLKNQRKTLKVLQGVATDKENLTGRPQLDKLSRLKAAVHETTISTNTSSDYAKRKKIETKAAETQTSPDSKSSNARKITAEDLCSEEKPGEHYWERLAEKRREALEQSLEENQRLYERIDGLEEELNTSRQQLEEAKHLVSVLTEMLAEGEEAEPEEQAAEEGEETEGESEAGVQALAAEESDDSNSSTPKADKQTQN